MNHKPFYPLKQEIAPLLEGSQTAIVRPIKNQPEGRGLRYEMRFNGTYGWEDWHGYMYDCPFGSPGTILWCKESFAKLYGSNSEYLGYATDLDECGQIFVKEEGACLTPKPYLFPANSMPKSVCRLWLEVVDVKVCKFGDVTDEMALRLGFDEINKTEPIDIHLSPKESFSWYWNHEYPLIDWIWYCDVKLIDKPENV